MNEEIMNIIEVGDFSSNVKSCIRLDQFAPWRTMAHVAPQDSLESLLSAMDSNNDGKASQWKCWGQVAGWIWLAAAVADLFLPGAYGSSL